MKRNLLISLFTAVFFIFFAAALNAQQEGNKEEKKTGNTEHHEMHEEGKSCCGEEHGEEPEHGERKTHGEETEHGEHEMHGEEMEHDEDMSNTDKEPWNEVCPVRGGEIDEAVAVVEYNGKYWGFCCPGCDEKFKENPEKYSKNVSEDGKEFLGEK